MNLLQQRKFSLFVFAKRIVGCKIATVNLLGGQLRKEIGQLLRKE